MSRAARKQAEMKAKLSGLDDELAAWLGASEKGGRLEKHHTQLRAVIGALCVPVEQLRARVEQPADRDSWVRVERDLLRVHEVWDFFRQKFALRAQALAALGRTDGGAARWPRWRGWLGEVFADVYGALAAGPAFGRALADFAATGPVATAGSPDYPPVRLRIRIIAEALARGDGRAASDDLLARWAADFPGEPTSPFDEDAAPIAQALATGVYPQFGGRPLTAVLDYPVWQETAEQTATALLKPSALSPAIDIRGLLAAAGLAFARDPARFADTNATAAVLAHARAIETKGLRATPKTVTAHPDRDTNAGHDLLTLLTRRP
jgi:hypothetical protein